MPEQMKMIEVEKVQSGTAEVFAKDPADLGPEIHRKAVEAFHRRLEQIGDVDSHIVQELNKELFKEDFDECQECLKNVQADSRDEDFVRSIFNVSVRI